jgi:hypothetical protein
VILINNAGVSSSSGEVPTTFEEMGAGAVAFIKGLELETLIPIRTRLALFRTNSDDIERIRPTEPSGASDKP